MIDDVTEVVKVTYFCLLLYAISFDWLNIYTLNFKILKAFTCCIIFLILVKNINFDDDVKKVSRCVET